MAPKISTRREIQNLRNTFNPKYIAQQKMATQSAASIEKSDKPTPSPSKPPTIKPNVARKKSMAVKGRGRGRGGRGGLKRSPPISLMLDSNVDVDSEEDEPTLKQIASNIQKDKEIDDDVIVGTIVEEEKETEVVGDIVDKEKEKESEKVNEKDVEEKNEKDEKISEKDEEREKESEIEKEKETESEKEAEKIDSPNQTSEKEVLHGEETIPNIENINESANEDTVADEFEPLFPEKPKTKSQIKITELFGDDDDIITETPTKSKAKSKAGLKRKKEPKPQTAKRPRYPWKREVLLPKEDDDVIEDKIPLNTCTELMVTTHDEAFKNEVLAHLNSLDLPDDTLKLCHGMLTYCFHSGRRYKKTWYDSSPTFAFFKAAIFGQGWFNLLDKHSPVYMSELIQFYATVKVDVALGNLSAFINQKPFALTIDQLASYLEVEAVGLTIFPKTIWGDIDEAMASEVMRTLRPDNDSGTTNIYAHELQAPHRFTFNLVHRAILPSNNSRGRCSLLEMLLIHHINKRRPINLPQLIFHRINEIAPDLQKGKFDKKTVIPYGMWLSIVFMKQKIVMKGSPGIEKLSDDMTMGLLSQMTLAINNGKLTRKFSGRGKTGATVGSTVEMGVVLGNLDKLMNMVSKLVVDNETLKEDVAELKTLNEDLIERVQALGGHVSDDE